MTTTTRPQLPFHRLAAYDVAVRLLVAYKNAEIRDAKLRLEGLKAAKSVCCNVAEGAGRFSQADKAQAFTIARGEALEAYAAFEIAALGGDADEKAVDHCLALTDRLYRLLTGLLR